MSDECCAIKSPIHFEREKRDIPIGASQKQHAANDLLEKHKIRRKR